jgi:peptidoglycan-associated lipoprotein
MKKEEKMRKRLVGIMLMLCFAALVAGGCAKQEVVKQDETLTQQEPVAAAAPVPVAQDAVVKEAPVKDTSLETASPFDTLYFDFDSYVLRQDARDALDKNFQWMKANAAEKVRLEGHCDERGSDEYNLALGEKRARAAQNYLSTLGVSADRLSIISYGKEKPADPGHNEDAWAKNRRVEFVIVK